ncbi:BTAD domain-containing putative transcriptional regulator [Georgenia sp. Z1491]|uniref:BTAD domain-containing putative transcriptional regulator n=1 Tax=Georgenia sp. Z1491 TaxID=3416707 RepID=UPI003CE8F7F3
MQVDVLGPIRLRTDAGRAVELTERQLRTVLAALVASEGRPITADTLIDRLWGDRLPAAPPKALRSKLSRLRTALDRAETDGRRRLRHTPAGYVLDLDPDAVDAGRFRRAIERARHLGPSRRQVAEVREALALWRGEPYGDLADDLWLAPVVAELSSTRADAVELLVEALTETGTPEQGIDVATSTVATHPARERLVAALMRALYQAGRQEEALGAFEALRHHLSVELGLDPGPQIRTLHQRILRHDPSLATSPAAAAPRASRSHLPAETEPLIGRREETRRIASLLATARLVTLTGIGGVGKTRLALHGARRHQAHTDGDAWFVDLTELSRSGDGEPPTGERLAMLAATVLDLSGREAGGGAIDLVVAALGARSGLLVLDNCEHVVDEAAAFAGEILARAPQVQVLTTSRRPLGLPAERRYDVATLSTEPGDGEVLSDAARFFVARARAGDPGLVVDEDAGVVITELCRRLDGLPLALELAASRIRGITVHELLERLSDRLQLLRRPGGGVPRRQQTLRGTIGWSWSLLDDAERTVLRRLAVHPGTVTLEAAESICGGAAPGTAGPAAGRSGDVAQVVDVLIGLVDSSMVRATPTPTGMRYGLLESISAFAGEKLDEAGERDGVARRHLDHYLTLACEVDRRLRGPDQQRWLALIDADRTQLRHAFDEATRRRDGASAVAIGVATFWHHWLAGRHTRLRDDLLRAVDLPGPRDDGYAAAMSYATSMQLSRHPGEEARMVAEALELFSGHGPARARAQWFAGITLLSLGLRADGERHVDEAIGVLADAGEEWDMAVAASQRDWFLVASSFDEPRGLPDGRDAGAVLRELGDGYGLSQVVALDHRAAEARGDHVRAGEAAREALRLSLDHGLWGQASEYFSATATAALRSGDVTTAHAHLARARTFAADTVYQRGSLFADGAAAMLARYEGDLPAARTALERWLSRGGVDITHAVGSHLESGFLAVQQADLARAEQDLATVRDLLPPSTDVPVVAGVLELAAAVRAESGDAAFAAELLGTAAAHRDRSGVPLSAPATRDLSRTHARLVEQIPADQVEAAAARGRTIDTGRQLTAIF